METKYIITNEKENSDFTVTYDCGHLIMMKEKLMFESIKGVQGRLTLEFKPTRYCPALNECLHKRCEGISIPSDFDGFDYFISNSGYVPSDTEFKTLTRLWKEYSISCQNYYYLCSPRGIHNITVIENIHNTNQMEVCNSCGNLYFGISDCFKIESVVRRLKADIDLSMDETCLDYLLKHRVIDDVEYKDYQLIRLARVNDYVRSFRQKINNRLINFTDYENKADFEKIDMLIMWSEKNDSIKCVDVFINKRIELAEKGKTDFISLDNFITKYNISSSPCTIQDREYIAEIIKMYKLPPSSLENYVNSSFYKENKPPFSVIVYEGLEDPAFYNRPYRRDNEAIYNTWIELERNSRYQIFNNNDKG